MHREIRVGITFSCDFTFIERINLIYNIAVRVFGFLRRNCWKFNDPACLRIIYFCLVWRPILEYDALIWKPNQDEQIVNLERLQNKFLRSLGRKINNTKISLNSLAAKFKIETLQLRRKLIDLRFLDDLSNVNNNCLGNFKFNKII